MSNPIFYRTTRDLTYGDLMGADELDSIFYRDCAPDEVAVPAGSNVYSHLAPIEGRLIVGFSDYFWFGPRVIGVEDAEPA